MTDPSGTHPPELDLGADDVVEGFEVLQAEEPVERVSGFDGIASRREARERALSLLYEAEQRGLQPLSTVLDDLPVSPDPYASELVVGSGDNLAEIDSLISEYSTSWPIERMPALDRALLRLGTFELLWTDVPTGVVISEAIELAKRYSTDDSHRFVNGMLARIAQDRPDVDRGDDVSVGEHRTGDVPGGVGEPDGGYDA